MSDVSAWRLFAFMDSDEDGVLDTARPVAEWQLQDVLRWCVTRGFDHIYFCRTSGRVRFERSHGPEGVRHVYEGLETTQDVTGDAA